MDKRDYVRLANIEHFVPLIGLRTGREMKVREFVYGVLVPDHSHPLSTVSVSNSSLSIDLWTGCALQCSYCHVQGTLEDLGADGRMGKKPAKRTKFSIDEIVDALVLHPFFVRDETVLSIGTASTEPFVPGEVAESTFEIMQAFVRRGFRNPFWIVTKAGVPAGYEKSLARIVKGARGVMISLCWADNPAEFEPARNNRFLRAEEAKAAGATLAWYLRPLVPEWGATPEHIEQMMVWVKDHYGGLIDVIVPGGLRWTEGIENGLVEIHGLPMPDIPRDDNVKALSEGLWESIMALAKEHFPNVPVYQHSSCALTHMLGVPSITSVQTFSRPDCERSSCPPRQRDICESRSVSVLKREDVLKALEETGISAQVVEVRDSGVVLDPPITTFTYAIRQTFLKALAAKGKAWMSP